MFQERGAFFLVESVSSYFVFLFGYILDTPYHLRWVTLVARPLLVLFPAHVHLLVRNGLVDEVESLGLITKM